MASSTSSIVIAGKKYAYVDQHPPEGTTPKRLPILGLFGFPDQWYGWQHQIDAWSSAGYRVIVPHMLGYGETDKPSEYSAYSSKNLCNDLASLLDALGLDKAIVVGHDWGAFMAWRFGIWHPQRIAALVALSISYYPPHETYNPEELYKRSPMFAYQLYFADPRSTAEIEGNLEVFLAGAFQAPPPEGQDKPYVSIVRAGEMEALVKSDPGSFERPPLVISDDEFQRYIADFKRDGMLGPLSYYRTSRIRFDEEKEAGIGTNYPSHIPVLFIYGTKDETAPQPYVNRMATMVQDLKVVQLKGKGHWILREAPDEIDTHVLEFLSTRCGDQVTQ